MKNGGSPSTISMTIIPAMKIMDYLLSYLNLQHILNNDNYSPYEMLYLPSDHISTSGPYGNRDITSGLIQYGVPTNDLRFGSSGDTCAQNPKSDNLTLK